MSPLKPPPLLDQLFIRYVPYDDRREVIIRRGAKMNTGKGMELSQRTCELGAQSVTLVRYMALLSPPAHNPKLPPLKPGALDDYKPEWEVLRLPEAEISIPRKPQGFSEAEVLEILWVLVPLVVGK